MNYSVNKRPSNDKPQSVSLDTRDIDLKKPPVELFDQIAERVAKQIAHYGEKKNDTNKASQLRGF